MNPSTPHPFRLAVLRGLAFILPPLLTIIFFLWVWSSIDTYLLRPIESGAQFVLAYAAADVLQSVPPGALPMAQDELQGRPQIMYQGVAYVKISGGWIPKQVADAVESDAQSTPQSPAAYYQQYVKQRYLKRLVVLPIFLVLLVACLYLLGKLLALRVGRFIGSLSEAIIRRLPFISKVYSAVKQVTDFVFRETQNVAYSRVVAVQYPRRGIWSVGFVTGESMLPIRQAAQEPVLSVLMPTSPMPATGFIVTVLKSETVDLNLTVDQAIQFIVSCGVVVPPTLLNMEDEPAAATPSHDSVRPDAPDAPSA